MSGTLASWLTKQLQFRLSSRLGFIIRKKLGALFLYHHCFKKKNSYGGNSVWIELDIRQLWGYYFLYTHSIYWEYIIPKLLEAREGSEVGKCQVHTGHGSDSTCSPNRHRSSPTSPTLQRAPRKATPRHERPRHDPRLSPARHDVAAIYSATWRPTRQLRIKLRVTRLMDGSKPAWLTQNPPEFKILPYVVPP